MPFSRFTYLQRCVVTAAQMTAIESRLFAAGMPVAALMEKVAGRIAQRVQTLYPLGARSRVGVMVGPGHNGGDALVVARELHLHGYEVVIYRPLTTGKELTAAHAQYAASLGIPITDEVAALRHCDWLLDGLFGFGLTRSLEGAIADAIDQVNVWRRPVVSIDLPSGLHTDTGAVLGTAVRATHSLCLGLWKRAFLQDQALDYIGSAKLLDFDLPLADVQAVLGAEPLVQRITTERAIAALPLPLSPITHKYKRGHVLLICGSRQYPGAAILSGLAARASGVGMLTVAVPASLQSMLVSHIPDALVLGCPETDIGAIAHLPPDLTWERYQAVACGPGLSRDGAAVVQQVVQSKRPLILDADGLNSLAALGAVATLGQRSAPTLLTPHGGEFQRLFPTLAGPDADPPGGDRLALVQAAAQACGAIVLLKGARVAIATPQGQIWLNPDSTPALARGGSGDILTGLMGGLMAGLMAKLTTELTAKQSDQQREAALDAAIAATWWHAQAALLAAQTQTELGVDASTLVQWLHPSLRPHLP